MGITDKVLGWLQRDRGTTGKLADAEEDALERERLEEKLGTQAGGYARDGTDFSSDQDAPKHPY
jgi:hypothetical protein